MAPTRHDRPACQVHLAFHEASRHPQQLTREDGDRGRDRDWRLLVVHEGPWSTERLGVEADRRVERSGEPVEAHTRQQLVLGEAAFDVAAAVAPVAATFDEPRGQPGRRVVHRPRERLWIFDVHRHVPRRCPGPVGAPAVATALPRACSPHERSRRARPSTPWPGSSGGRRSRGRRARGPAAR